MPPLHSCSNPPPERRPIRMGTHEPRLERMVLAMKIGLLAKAWRVVRADPLKRIQKTLNRCITALAIVLGLVVIAAPSAQAQTFDAPGAGTGPLQGTLRVSINTAR